jgi:hypothetical protein
MTVADEVPAMPGGQRVLGHALEFGRDPLALFQRAREHGDVVRIRFGPFGFYVLNSPNAIRQALVGEARKLGKGLNFGRPAGSPRTFRGSRGYRPGPTGGSARPTGA